MDDFNEDSLRIDREETITLNNITFEREVKMFEVNIPGIGIFNIKETFFIDNQYFQGKRKLDWKLNF